MEYRKIRELIKETKVDKAHFFDSIGMSEVGFNKMMKLESCKVSTLEAIARYFSKPIEYFFYEGNKAYKQDEVTIYQTGEPGPDYPKLLAEKDTLINQQKEFIRLMLEGNSGNSTTQPGEVTPPKARIKGFRSLIDDPKFHMLLKNLITQNHAESIKTN